MTETPTVINSELEKFKPIVADEKELNQLKSDYEKLVVTEANLADADNARLKLKNKRLDIQRMEKSNDELLKKLRKDNSGKAEKLIEIIKPTEDRLDADIKAVKEAIETKKQEAIKKEQERIKKHKDGILLIQTQTAKLALSDDVEGMRANIKGIKEVLGTFEEFEEEARQALELYEISANQRIEFLEMKAKAAEKKPEPVEEKETAAVPVQTELFAEDKPSQIMEVPFEEPVQGTPPNTVKGNSGASPSILTTNPLPLQVPVNMSYGGFVFHIPTNIPEADRNKIIEAIQGIVDNIELA